MPVIRRAPLVAALALVAGCSMSLYGEYPTTPPPRACLADSDCVTERGEICRLANGAGAPVNPTDDEGKRSTDPVRYDGICVLRSTSSAAQIFLEVRPATGAALPPAQLGPIQLSAGQNQQLVLPAPVAVYGQVSYADASASPVKRARLRFRSKPLIGGRPLTFDVESADGEGPDAGRFLRVLPSDAYAVTIIPPDVETGTGAVLPAPPERPFGDALTDVLSGLREFRFTVTPAEAYVRVSGTIRRRGNGTEEGTGVEGLEVWAVDARAEGSILPGNLKPTSKRLCQPVQTDRDGRYTLFLPALAAGNTHDIQLRMGPPPGGSDLPSYAPTKVWSLDRSAELEPIVLDRIDERVQVRGVVRGLALPATVQLRTVLRDEIGYAKTVTTDAVTGEFTAEVPRAVYVAWAEPDGVESTLGVCLANGEVRAEDGTVIDLLCPPTTRFSGRVIDSNGMPVSGVTVEVTRRADEVVDETRRGEAFTDADGSFVLPLGEGTYDFSLQPPASSRLPYQTLRGIKVDPKYDPGLTVIELGQPFELFGRLLGGDMGSPIAASLEAYAVDAVTNEAVLVGRGLARDDGSYSIVVPAAAP